MDQTQPKKMIKRIVKCGVCGSEREIELTEEEVALSEAIRNIDDYADEDD